MMKEGRQDFHDLMRYRIMDILLVASPYDSFVLEEAGDIGERMLGEFRNLDLHYTPGITTVPTGAEALALLEERRFGLVISGLHLADMRGDELARRVADAELDVPVVLLGFDARDVADVDARVPAPIFLWQGDARILLAIVKCVEDARNAAHDTQSIGVQVIILIEDNVRYYSSFLPAIYAELLEQSRRLVPEGMNFSHKITRMRARPKILLCRTYEDAWQAFERYGEEVLGVISDVEFPRGGAVADEAGLDFAREVHERWADVPVLLQSSNPAHAERAGAVGASFLLKGSPLLLGELSRFMTDYFGFGDFIFRLRDGSVVGRAHDLRSLEEVLRTAPLESIAYHADRNHFSKWLKARTEFALADEVRPRRVSDFAAPEDLRAWLIDTIARYRHERSLAAVADFDAATFAGWVGDARDELARIGGGSLGGKARGLAFMRTLLSQHRLEGLDADVSVSVPPAVVIATDVFDRFLEESGLRDFAIHCDDDAELERRFVAAPLPARARRDLAAVANHVRSPLAVRSSSLLEDSQHQPFSGVYETFMLANAAEDPALRHGLLCNAVKRVYASTFAKRAKDTMRATPFRLEEEKMAVIVQRVVGRAHGTRFYPDISGVARSHNFYPTAPLLASDGVAAVALGLGRSVVTDGTSVQFCPRAPEHIASFKSHKETMASAQRVFWALDLAGGGMRETRFELEDAEADGVLGALASTWSPDNDALYDGVSRPGVRVLTFAQILKRHTFPLARVVDALLAMGTWGMGAAVEIEFAVDLASRTVAFLQLRPLTLWRERVQLDIADVGDADVVCRSDSVLGNGRIDDIHDVVVVDSRRFDRSASQSTAEQIGRFNAELAGRKYLLIGVGRWGSSDPWLGIPVRWDQISGARVIVEAGFEDFKVTPSQGTHFFQNLTSFNIGYFTVNPDAGQGFVDWEWLAGQPAVKETPFVRHIRSDKPFVVKMNGQAGEGVVLRPCPDV